MTQQDHLPPQAGNAGHVRPLLPQTFSGFGIELRRLRHADLPLLCQWRNSDDILRYMDDVRKVSVPVLEFWLKKTEASGHTFPFLAYSGGEPIAYIDVRNCDYARSRCEDGIYLFDSRRRQGTGLGSKIWLCREQILQTLGIQEVFSAIRPENRRSRCFFEKMGATLLGMENGLLLYQQQPAARWSALRRVAATLNLSDTFEKYYGT